MPVIFSPHGSRTTTSRCSQGSVRDCLPLWTRWDRSTTSPLASPRRSAVAGAISTGLSQLTLVSGRGNSCSHPLLANRPSQTWGSGRNVTARPPDDRGGFAARAAADHRAAATAGAPTERCRLGVALDEQTSSLIHLGDATELSDHVRKEVREAAAGRQRRNADVLASSRGVIAAPRVDRADQVVTSAVLSEGDRTSILRRIRRT